ncbi:MAG: hypothetical protein RL030_2392, partial [Pseudomonadota bacterium]
FGLKTLSQLPPLAELKSLEDLNPQLALPEPLGAVLASPLLAETLVEDEDPTEESTNDALGSAAAQA